MDLLEKYRFKTRQDRLKDGEKELGSTTSSSSKESQSSDTFSPVSGVSLTTQKSSVNGSECSQETTENVSSSLPSMKKHCNGVTFLPETPEDLLKHSKINDANSHRVRLDSVSDSEDPVVALRKPKGKRILLTDSDSDSDQSHSGKTKRVRVASDGGPAGEKTAGGLAEPNAKPEKSVANDLFSSKELSLRTLMQTFPKMDLMKVQDTLVKCDWYAKKAIHVLREKCDPATCEHVPKPVLQPSLKTGNEPEPKSSTQPKPNFYKLPLIRESRLKISDFTEIKIEERFMNSSVPNTHVPSKANIQESDKPEKKTEPSITVQLNVEQQPSPTNNDHNIEATKPDMTSDDQSIAVPPCTPDLTAANSTESQNSSPVKRKVVRHRINQISSDSDSDGSSDGVKIISMESLEKENEKKQAAAAEFKVVRQNEHNMSSEDGENGEKGSSRPPSPKSETKRKKKKRKRKDVAVCSDDEVDFARDELYDSDDSDIDDQLTPAREAVLNFYRNGSSAELLTIPGCSKKKAEAIINLRPINSWVELVTKLQNHKNLSTDMLGGARDVIVTREVMSKLMQKCEKIASDMEKVSTQMTSKNSKGNCIKEQPSILNPNLKLSPYQLIGLNWLWVMHSRQLNGILADEMGLGKTIQAISFLAHLKMTEGKKSSRHLVIVPSSTLDNWIREFQTWCPSMEIITYHGSQELRRELRMQIINDEIEHFDVMMTTYNMLSSCPEDRTLFRRLAFHYVVFDEAHMLKNMNTQRYQNLMKIKADRRLLLTGTPLQNNLVELMSLLIFVMPNMFYNKIDQVKQMFASACKSEENRSIYEKNRIDHAKRIMKPFVLRRLKNEVLKELPTKHEELLHCSFTPFQKDLYTNLVKTFTKKLSEDVKQDSSKQGGVVMMMELRKAANHPLLLRHRYTDQKIREMSKKLINEPTYAEANSDFIFEDMEVMSDFELHRLCKNNKSISAYKLADEDILDSGKFHAMDKMLPEMKEQGSRFLLFSQFTMMLDIVEEYMAIRNYTYLRLDGSTPVPERQELMDRFNGNPDIFAFLLSTRAGGLGINLTAANVVLLHDIDFNPYNDKQAEDRCHRLGQTREVTVKKMIMENTIEEAILQCAMDKLKLERDITTDDTKDAEEDMATVGNILKSALRM